EQTHTSEGHDRLGEIPLCRFLEVEHHREEPTRAQCGAQRIKDGFALTSKPPENQDALLADGIDDLTNLLVVEQQVDELCNLQIVHRDHRLTLGADDQIRLLRPNKVDVPCGNAIDLTPREICSLKVGPHQDRFTQVCLAEVHPGEVCPAEVRPAE